ncbi:hypothetical protein L6R53_22465 [Myxococcota bacterium]|nr:hypothetical protein [Myxococcota bacterium]
MNWEVWGPPTVVAGIGLAAGLVVALRARKGGAGGATRGGLTREDLLTRKLALVEQLRGLEAERGKLPPSEFQERWRLVLDRAARAERELERFDRAQWDEERVELETSRSAEGRSFGRAGWAAAVVVFFVVLGLTLTQATKPRGDGGMTGATVDQRQKAMEELAARLAKDPSDVDAATTLAHASIRSGDLEAGMRYVEAARQVAPEDPRVQASLAALMLAIGYQDRAAAVLDQALASDPTLGTAWLWKGVLEMGRGNPQVAAAAFEKVMTFSKDAEDRRIAASMLVEAQSTVAGGGAAPAASAAPAAAGAGPATTAGPVRVAGRVELASGTAAPPPGAMVFIYARTAAEAKGPPVAARKVPASSLPLDFQLGDADIMMQGVPWPDQVWVSARVDLDGNAMTREEGAPLATPIGPVSAPEAPVVLVLQ